jgi:nucleoside phosphorylase
MSKSPRRYRSGRRCRPLPNGSASSIKASLATSTDHPRPFRREDFEIAIICALPLEYDAVTYVFEDFFDEDGDPYGKAEGDPNIYATGRIGKHNVVLALLSHKGKAHASSAAASISMSYTRLRLALLVGICGGVPRVDKGGKDEILLGDVVISKTIVQYNFGRQYTGKFVRKNTAEDNPSKLNKYVRNLLTQLETDCGRRLLKQKTARFLKELQAKAESNKYDYPGTEEDKLFKSSYRHKHYINPTCGRNEYRGTPYPVYDDALNSSCEEVGCDESQLVRRKRLEIK